MFIALLERFTVTVYECAVEMWLQLIAFRFQNCTTKSNLSNQKFNS